MSFKIPRLAFFLAAILFSESAFAQSGLLVPTSTGRPDATVLSMRELVIDASIARGCARVNVKQVFENHTNAIQEGTYRFALPSSAAVSDFAVWDGLVRIPGVILEKRRARAIYDALTKQRVDPGLLQQGEEEDRAPGDAPTRAPTGAALFSVKVAPIPALGTKRLELQFSQNINVVGLKGELRIALAPVDGEPPIARTLRIHVSMEGAAYEAAATGLPLRAAADGVTFEGSNVKIDRDVIVRFTLKDQPPLKITTFRNPDGHIPDGLTLAPWERASDIPPDRDGFFLMEVLPPAQLSVTPVAAGALTPQAPSKRPAVQVAALFDTSLSHRFSGLKTSYQRLVRLLDSLTPDDKFALIPYDETVDAPAQLESASPAAKKAALDRLLARPLSPGTNTLDAVRAAQRLVGDSDKSRIVLLTDGAAMPATKDLTAAKKKASLFVSVGVGELGVAIRNVSDAVVTSLSTEPDTDLFFERVIAPRKAAVAAQSAAPASQSPVRATEGDPGLRDVYAVMVQPPTEQSLSGFIGRYSKPAPQARLSLASGILPKASSTVASAFPARDLAARDLPRRWARARVDDLLARIEAEGERREWVEEIIELSRRYKFVTPYTAFLAAPRSLLRPRRIQPGDPVLRVECDEATVQATALFPFGLKLPLVRRPKTNVFEGRFLVPDSLKDGRYTVEIVMRDRSGLTVSETKTFVIDGRAPRVTPTLPVATRVGDDLLLQASTDDDVIFITARVGDLPPQPLRWDKTARASIGRVHIPSSVIGRQEVVFEAIDLAKNVGFARATIEVRP